MNKLYDAIDKEAEYPHMWDRCEGMYISVEAVKRLINEHLNPNKHTEAMKAASNLHWSPENPDKPIEDVIGIPTKT